MGTGVIIIGDDAFNNCTNLTTVSMSKGVSVIGKSAFNFCNNLSSVSLPNSITEISDNAFINCPLLTSIVIGNEATKIGSGAFINCRGLTSITIGKKVATIGANAFKICSGLTEVYSLNPIPLVCEAASFTPGENVLYVPIGFKAADKNYAINKVTLNDMDITAQLTNGTYTIESLDKNINLAVVFKATYTITTTCNAAEGSIAINGKTSSPITMQAGTKVEFTISSKEKYEIENLTLNGKDVTVGLKGTTYTLQSLNEDVLLEATFKIISSINRTNSDEIKVYASSVRIIIENALPKQTVSIYNVTGQSVYTETDTEIALANGIYLAKTGNVIRKAVVE